MPTSIRSFSDSTVRTWLWGLLPDSQAVLESWARYFHVSARSPFGLLGTPIGRDCPGAVRFIQPHEVQEALADPGQVDWLDDLGVARRLEALEGDATAWLGRTFTGQFSLAGAQSKTALLLEDGKWGVPSGARATTHILKPGLHGFAGHQVNEHLCLAAARRLGIVAVRSWIGTFANHQALIVERYDRLSTARGTLRLHQEDLCQALGVHPSRKYQNEGGPGPKEVGALLRFALPPAEADEAVIRFADALLWNWIIGGTDAHAKNYSVLLEGRRVLLAPLYDVASALPYGTHPRDLRMAMKIGSHYELDLWPGDWAKTARVLGLSPDLVIDRARHLARGTADAFRSEAARLDLTEMVSSVALRLVDLIARRAQGCMSLLSASSRSKR